MATDIATRLRQCAADIRRTPVRLDTWIPLQQEAADTIDALRARVAELEARPVAWCSEDCRLNGCEAARASYFASMNAVRGSDKQCRAAGNKPAQCFSTEGEKSR